MSVITFPGAFTRRSEPVVLMMDMQMEFVVEGRAFAAPDADRVVANCRRVLDAARTCHLPIVHFRRECASAYFNPHSAFTNWIDGFQPLQSEAFYFHETLSCFDHDGFAEYIGAISNPLLVIVGFNLEGSCLETAMESRRRGTDMWFLHDAVGGAPLGGLTNDDSRRAAIDLVGRYAEPRSTDEFLLQFNVNSDTMRSLGA